MRSKPFVLGLTGSIGSGKSTASKLLKKRDTSLLSADKIVHDLLKKGGKAVRPVLRLFPDVGGRDGIDRKKLGRFIFQNPKALQALEKILHPLVEQEERLFVKEAARKGKKFVVIEIPLLFETKAEKRCDATLCLVVSQQIQKQRVLSRPGMTEQKLRSILRRQMKDKERRKRADYVIDTSKGLEDTKTKLEKIRKSLEAACVKSS